MRASFSSTRPITTRDSTGIARFFLQTYPPVCLHCPVDSGVLHGRKQHAMVDWCAGSRRNLLAIFITFGLLAAVGGQTLSSSRLIEPTGACCLARDCAVLTMEACQSLGGTYLGDGAACDDPGNDDDGDGLRNACDQCAQNETKTLPASCGCASHDAFVGLDFATSFGTAGTGDSVPSTPWGVAVDAAGRIIVSDVNNDCVRVYNADGLLSFVIGGPGSEPGEFADPSGVAVDRFGRIFVADASNHRVQAFDHAGTFLFLFGGQGDGPGYFDLPVGITTDAIGNIYVADSANDRVQVFSSTAEFLFQFGMDGQAIGELKSPLDVAVHPDGRIFVADTLNSRVQVFDAAGTLDFVIGAPGVDAGEFVLPRGITVGRDSLVYVADSTNHRVQVFADDGTLLDVIGSFGSGAEEFQLPAGIAVDAAGLVHIADFNNARVQIAERVTTCNICPGDSNGDLFVSLEDLLGVLSNWGGTGPSGDVNADAGVDLQDLLDVLANWGGGCAAD